MEFYNFTQYLEGNYLILYDLKRGKYIHILEIVKP
jgi:hypothetical protein